MPTTALTVVTSPGAYPTVTANSLDVAFTAADASNGNHYIGDGTELILVLNTDSGAHTVTVTSVADSLGRTGHITAYSLGAGEYALLGPVKLAGWADSTGKVLISANDATVKFLVVRPHS